ncbi:MAG: 6-carboxytetrahydropterin synthase [Bryobacteraceae bacterium]|nr:6-carboxytetrahydropterin synthase [Bryobacteraceae bacterium]
MLITRKAEFSASHTCRLPGLSEAENEALYGPEAHPRGHGHNFSVEVTLEGEPDPVTGMVYDLKRLKQILHERVVEPFDHRFLNLDVPPFDQVVPTLENIALEIWRRLQPDLAAAGVRLYRVRVSDSDQTCVEVLGEPQ